MTSSPPPSDGTVEGLSISQVMPVVYDELRRLARHYLRGERAQSLQATALVNEAYVRLAKEKTHAWRNRAHFCGIAASAMREILVERARARKAVKRGGSRVRVTLDDGLAVSDEPAIDVLGLDEALKRLAEVDPQLVRLVEFRFFGGLSIEEAAETLRVSPATVKRGWNFARAWLKREMEREK